MLSGAIMTTEDLSTDEHYRSRGVWDTIDHPATGPLEYPGRPTIMSASPRPQPRRAPLPGPSRPRGARLPRPPTTRRAATRNSGTAPAQAMRRTRRRAAVLTELLESASALRGDGAPDTRIAPTASRCFHPSSVQASHVSACQTSGVENPAGSRFCGSCGAPLARVCGACGSANDPAMRFCNQCGAPLVPAADLFVATRLVGCARSRPGYAAGRGGLEEARRRTCAGSDRGC